MARSIDERVVSMAFDNARFEAGVAQTMKTLQKLDQTLATIGAVNGLSNIEKAGNKVTLEQPMSALDKLKTRLFGAGKGAAEGMNEIEKAGNKVQLEQPIRALNKVQSQTAQVGAQAADGFNEIERAAGRVDLHGLNSALDSVQSKFSALTIIATSALSTIVMDSTRKGVAFGKSFGVGPILDGLHEYETNLKSIQTIQANTDRPLTEINRSLEELNRYSDQTIYNFSEMAKNIGTFTAAGVDLKTATSSIKGIANMAALSGSSSQQAATAMYQLSQAISSGRVGLQDWNSVVNAGMGGKKLQNALAQTAIAMGDIGDSSVKLEGPLKKLTINGQSFRESIMAKPGQVTWLSSDVLVNTLATLDGRFSRAALSAELTKDGLKKYTAAQVEAEIATARTALEQKNGVKYTDEQFKALMKLSDSAFKSATEVKTLGQVFDVAKETIGSGWAASFQSIFGNLTEAKKTFTGLSNALNGFINAGALARNTMLHDWKELGGRTALIEGIKNAFKALFAILKPIGEAFRDIFPRKTGAELAEMTKNFANFTAGLKPGAETIDGIKRTFRGLFAVLHIGWSIVKGVIGVIAELLGTVGKGSGGFLNFTGSIGDFLVAVDQALTRGGLLTSFFDGIAKVLKVPLQLLGGVASAIFGLFSGFDQSKANGLKDSIDGVSTAITPFQKAIIQLKNAWAKFVDILNQAKDLVSPWLDRIGQQMSNLGETLGNALENVDFDKVLSVLQTGFIGGIFIIFRKAITGVSGELGGALNSLSKTFGGLTGHLKTMQQDVKVNMILKIAAAIGILAAGVYVLSKIDPAALTKAMGAVAVGLGQLVGAMAILAKVMQGGGYRAIIAMPLISASLVALATAVVILAAAVKIFSTMSWDELARGLVGVGGALGAIAVGMKLLGPGTIIQAPLILLLAIALNALALAVKQFASMNWEELGRGLAGVLGALVALIAPITAFGPGLLLTGPGLIAVAFAMNMLAGAVRSFGDMNLKELGTGLLGISLAIVAIGLGIGLIPPTIALQAAGLVILAVALSGIAGAVKMFGSIGILGLVKGLIAMGSALLILGVGLTVMAGTLPGSIALLAAATALAVLAPTLGFLGTMKWSTILKGLGAMALALGVLSIVGALAGPGLASLGVSLLPLAAVFIVTAGAVFIFAKALEVLGAGGTKGIAVMVAALTAFLTLLPNLVIDFIKGLVGIIEEVAKIAPQVVTAITKILDSVIEVVIRAAPRLGVAIGVLIDTILLLVAQKSPNIIAAGWKLLIDFLSGISKNLPEVIAHAGSIIVKFLEGLAAQVPNIVAAGGKLLMAYISGITSQIPLLIAAAARAVATFIASIAQRLPGVIAQGTKLVVSFIRGIGAHIGKVLQAGVNVIVNLIRGLGKAAPRVIREAVNLAGRIVRSIANGLLRLVNVAFETMIKFMNGLARSIRENGRDLRAAGWNLASAIIEGLAAGFRDLAWKAVEGVKNLIGQLPNAAKKLLGINSPSRVFAEIGLGTMEGLANGISQGGSDSVKAVETAGNRLVTAAQRTLSSVPDLLNGMMDLDPTITPVLDLSAVEKEATKLGDLTNVTPITAAASFGQALAISDEKASSDLTRETDTVQKIVDVHLEQNLHSPKALDNVEIYRQTNNQLSKLKSAVGLAS